MDFFHIVTKEPKNEGPVEVRPGFIVARSKDLMVRGKSFYAIWDEEIGLWSTDEFRVAEIVDKKLYQYAEEQKNKGIECDVKALRTFSNKGWAQFRQYLSNLSDNSHPLDKSLTFKDTPVKKEDHVSRRLPYSLINGKYDAWNEIVGTLYDPVERAKIEWAIGAVVSGDSKNLDKFLVFYGDPGTGKGTILGIIQRLFGGLSTHGGYVTTFDAKALTGGNNAFAMEAFKNNPLVAIQHDGDLSRIEDNSLLNMIVSHEDLRINEKFKPTYNDRSEAFLFLGTNKPVKISDAKSGLVRRLIDVYPSGRLIGRERYRTLKAQINFEHGAIAQHCLEVYREMGPGFYDDYIPITMMEKTDVFFNFVGASYDVFERQNGVSLKQAFSLYKEYIKDSQLEYKLPHHKFREELKNYFDEFHDRIMIDGLHLSSYFQGFKSHRFDSKKEPTVVVEEEPESNWIVLDQTVSLLDEELSDMPAQYTNEDGLPSKLWTNSERIGSDGKPYIPKPSMVVSTVLSDMDTTKLHYVKVPEQHIVIDFDLTDETGNKSLEMNLAEAAKWPSTYAELSKGGGGLHLHYDFVGDVTELAGVFSPGIEVKTLLGDSGLRRKLTKCNDIPVATISGGLPIKEKKVLDPKVLQNEQVIRAMISNNLMKKYHQGTKPSVDFIKYILDNAYASGVQYDVTNMRGRIALFAAGSTNQKETCIKTVARMKFASADPEENRGETYIPEEEEPLVFFDCEVYPNFFGICWLYENLDGVEDVVRMINPTPDQVRDLFKLKLVGFYNRDYDNHILYARSLGYTNEELYKLSQRLTSKKDRDAKFREAYNLSYADVLDVVAVKQGLKKYQIELGIHHQEMDIPWDEPVPDDRIDDVMDYCANDVVSTKAVYIARKQDFVARKILADMSGLTMNDPTRSHVTRILVGRDRNPQEKFIYTDLSEMFKGYKFDQYATVDKSTYRGVSVGEGGLVYAKPGMYEHVVLLDVASMHPTSIEKLNLFGPYTEKYSTLKNARLAIKHANDQWKKGNDKKAQEFLAEANRLLPGVDITEENAEALSEAIKLVLNSTYGFTCARFENPLKDPRNKDNIVAKRGALFMVDLMFYLEELGFPAIHIKTDSVKIAGATPEVIEKVIEFGKKYGYDFEHEATYEKFCLVNDAVYIAYVKEGVKKDKVVPAHWTATGAQFKHPYVFKKLFSGDRITFKDLCETKEVKDAAIWLEFGSKTHHVGKTGQFIPVVEEAGGGVMVRVKGESRGAVTGTKGYLWLEASSLKTLFPKAVERMAFESIDDAVEGTGSIVDVVDMSYYEKLAEAARDNIRNFGNFEEFVGKNPEG